MNKTYIEYIAKIEKNIENIKNRIKKETSIYHKMDLKKTLKLLERDLKKALI